MIIHVICRYPSHDCWLTHCPQVVELMKAIITNCEDPNDGVAASAQQALLGTHVAVVCVCVLIAQNVLPCYPYLERLYST